jgi:hypothetical protein
MALKEIAQAEFARLCPNTPLPPSTAAEAWYATDGNEFTAVIVRHRGNNTWAYLVFQPGSSGPCAPIASANSFDSRPDHELRGKLQELLFCQAME